MCDPRRQWQPTPVLLPGKSHGRRSLGRLQSMGSQRVGHDWATSLSCIGEANVLAWRISGTEEPAGLLSMGLHRVGHDWSDSAAAAAAEICWNMMLFSCLIVVKVEMLLGSSMCDIARRKCYMMPEEKREWIGGNVSIRHHRDQGRRRGCPLWSAVSQSPKMSLKTEKWGHWQHSSYCWSTLIKIERRVVLLSSVKKR